MSGVGYSEQAFGVDVGGEAGGESALQPADHACVERSQHGCGIGAVRGLGADGAYQHGNHHGRGQAFAADVAHDNQHASPAVGNLLEKVAAHFLGRLVDALDGEARALLEFSG